MTTEYYTYTHSAPDGTIFYVGAGVLKRARGLTKHNVNYRETVARYGRENVQIDAQLCANRADAFAWEEEMILAARAAGASLLNKSSGGIGGAAGVRPDAKTRAKLSAARTGKTHSTATKAKIGAAHTGRALSAEARAKISASHTGKTHSAETKAKMSASRKGGRVGEKNGFFGKTHSAETKAKMRAALTGRTHSAETKAKLSAAQAGRAHTAETKAKMSASQRARWVAKGATDGI